jgi:hypothetical protein
MMMLFEHLSPGDRLGELLFGLIMTLTFTLGAGVMVGTSDSDSASLLAATLGCNVAWGVIDGALLLLGRMFDRGRLARLGHVIASAPSEGGAVAIVAQELDDVLLAVTSEPQRAELYRDVVARVRSGSPPAPRLAREDFVAALAVFVLVFGATLPAALPHLLIDDSWVAQRVSNALLIGVLFFAGYRWARYTCFPPLASAFVVGGLSVALVAVAIALGG